MPAPRRLPPLSTNEILDRAVRLYRTNLRAFLRATVPLVVGMALGIYAVRRQGGLINNWGDLFPVRLDALPALLGGFTGPVFPSSARRSSWDDLLPYLALQVFLVGTIVPLSAQLHLGQFTQLLPSRDSRLAGFVRLLVPLVLLLPIDALIASLARLFEILPLILGLGVLGARAWPVFVRLTTFSTAPFLVSMIGVFVVARLWCAPQAIVLEGCRPLAGLRRSWSLTRGQFGRVIALIADVSVLVALVGAIPTSAALIVDTLAKTEQLSVFLLGGTTFVAKIVQVLLLPLPPIVATLLYYDLRTRAEGYDLEVAARQALLDRAETKLKQADLQGALADYEEIRQFSPNDFQLLCTLVDLKVRLGDHTGALAESERALVLFPKNMYSWNNRGYVRSQLGDLDGALADLNRALRGAPHNPMALTNRARVLHQRGDYEAARTDLFHALQFARDDARVMFNLACGYARQAQREPALDWLERAIATDQDFRDQARTDGDFDSLRADPRFVALVIGTQGEPEQPPRS